PDAGAAAPALGRAGRALWRAFDTSELRQPAVQAPRRGLEVTGRRAAGQRAQPRAREGGSSSSPTADLPGPTGLPLPQHSRDVQDALYCARLARPNSAVVAADSGVTRLGGGWGGGLRPLRGR